MFWHMDAPSTASPVETILDKDDFTLEELLVEDDIFLECRALNDRLINFLQERDIVKQLIQFIVEEPPEGTEKQRAFKLAYMACEIFTFEVDIILKPLTEDEELMDLLFSFLEPERPHNPLSAGYFSKVVLCLLMQKTTLLLNYIQAHQDIIKRLVDLIGITSIMEVLIRLIGTDEHFYANCAASMQWMEEINVLEMIVEKFGSSDCPEVHANAAETLCTITRYAPPELASKISCPSFIKRLFSHILDDSRPKSVLVNLLSVCIFLLDYMHTHQMIHGPGTAAGPEIVSGMLDGLGDLFKLLEISSKDKILLTTYGKLQPPLGKHRLKIIEFISVLVTVGNEVAEKELIRLDAVKHILELFFGYPYNNFLHYHVKHLVISCLESTNPQLVGHLLHDCNLVGRILEAEKNFTLTIDKSKPTILEEGRKPPRIGNIGHLTRIANKLIQLGSSNSDIQAILQENSDWVDWQTNVLLKRNAVENITQWACGRPVLEDQNRDSDKDDYQDRDYDVAALAKNLSEAIHNAIYNNDSIDEDHGSTERDDVYFDDKSAEVVMSSLRMGDGHENESLLTNSNCSALQDDKTSDEHSPMSTASLSPNTEDDLGSVEEDDDSVDTSASEQIPNVDDNMPSKSTLEWVEWRESSDSFENPPPSDTAQLPNGEMQVEFEDQPDKTAASPASMLTLSG